MIQDFVHVGISVFDLETSVRFYTEVLDMQIDYRAHHRGDRISRVVGVPNAELNICVLKKGGTRLELIDYGNAGKKTRQYKDQDSPGLIHLALKVSDVDGEYRRLKSMGYEFNSPPMVTRDNGPKICYFLGPDNVVLELYEVVTPASE
jgi:catechol 2,3-dioxygenase-like lactoylglutathione lyase family enzyme